MSMLNRKPRPLEELQDAARWLAYEWAMFTMAPEGKWLPDDSWIAARPGPPQDWREDCVGCVGTEVELLHLRNLHDFLCALPQEGDISALDFLSSDAEKIAWALGDHCPTIASHMKYINRMLLHLSWSRAKFKEQAPPNGWNDWKPKYRVEVRAALAALGERIDPSLRKTLRDYVRTPQTADDEDAYPGLDLPVIA